MSSHGESQYRWSRTYGLRIVGVSVVVLAVGMLVAAVTGFPWWAWTAVAAFGVLVVGCLVRLVLVPPLLLEVSSEGYRLHHVRGGGVQRALWSEVTAVEGGTGAEGAVMSIVLDNGRTTLVPLMLLGPRGNVAEREMHDRLNAAFGYRRLGDR